MRVSIARILSFAAVLLCAGWWFNETRLALPACGESAWPQIMYSNLVGVLWGCIMMLALWMQVRSSQVQ